MPAPANLLEQATALAREPLGSPMELRRTSAGGICWPEMQNRAAHIMAAYEWYEGRTIPHIDPMPGETPQEARERAGRIFINWFARIVDLRCSTYDAEPARTLYTRDGNRWRKVDDENLVCAVNELYDEAGVDEALSLADKDRFIGGNTILRPLWDADASEMVIHSYTSPQIRVVENKVNPRRPWATVLIGRDRVLQKDISIENRDVAEIWEANRLTMLPGGGSEPITNNPLVHLFERPPTNRTGYYTPAPGVSLCEATHRFDQDFLGQYGNILLLQGFGQPVLHGVGERQKIVIGPNRAIQFSGDPERREGLEFPSPNAPLADWLESLKFYVDQIRESCGIPSSMIDVQNDASGRAIIQANAPTVEMRAARLKTFRKTEVELLRALLYEASAGGFPGIPSNINPEDFTVAVSYAPSAASVAVGDRVMQEKHDLEIGITTPARLLFRREPDMFDSEADAQAWIDANIEEQEDSPEVPAENNLDNEQ